MRDSASKTQGVVDFGTSPHGLPAGHQRTYRKSRQADGLHSLADGFGVAPANGADRSAARTAPDGSAIEPAGLTFTFTEEQRRAVSHALLEIASELEEGHEAHDPWIQEEIARLWGVREMLEKAFYQRRRTA